MPFPPDGFYRSREGKLCFPLLILFCLSFCAKVYSQYNPDSITERSATDTLRSIYLAGIGEGSLFYSGVQYIRNGQKTDGFPFFGSEEPFRGTVCIRGVRHPAAVLQLDLVTGQLISSNFNGTALFVIEPSLVDSFFLDGHLFVAVPAGRSTSVMRAGYYECIRAQGMTLYIGREKQLQSRPGYDLSAYRDYDRVFILREGTIHVITGKKDLLDLLSDRKDDLKKFIRDGKLNFTRQPAEAAIRIFQHLQGITQQ